MRYTETRLAPVSYQGMLDEISEATVDFSDNFDSSQQEPVVLPAQLPILLLNGCAGIAVGMATNIPPHNLAETVDGLIALIDKPDLTDEKLWQLIPGPDFPTGGEIVETKGIQDAYLTGKGIIKVRGVAKAERLTSGKKRRREKEAIIVTELPYQVNKAGWIEKVADLVNQGRIEGISDIRDESDRTGMRVVIELKRDTRAKKVLQELYRQTALQTNFGAILLALVDNRPVQLSLRQLLTEFLQFRELTLTRQYSHELAAAERRLHLVEGLLIALNNLDRVIDVLRNAPDGTTAKFRLEEELGISPEQGDSILAMPMRRLTGLERQKLETEAEELQTGIAQLNKVLGDRHELLKALKKELRALKRKFGDERRTRIISVSATAEKKVVAATKTANGTATEEQPQTERNKLMMLDRSPRATIQITHQGCVFWQNPSENAKDSQVKLESDLDFVVQREPIGDRQKLIVVTDSGKAYPLAIADIPSALETTSQTAVSLLSPAAQRDAQRTVAHFFLPENTSEFDLIMLTRKGIIKRLKASELEALGNRGLVLIKIKERDSLEYFCFTREGAEVAIATTGGRILRLPVDEAQIPTMGRSAQGNKVMRLRVGEQLAGCCAVTSKDSIALVSHLGYVKRLPVNALRLANRGDIGTQAIQFADENDSLAGAVSYQPQTQLLVMTDSDRRLVLSATKIPLLDKNSTGEKPLQLNAKEAVVTIALTE